MSCFSFEMVLGQVKAKSLLLKAINRQKVAHAYLFQGPVGGGKKTLALAFSAVLNCLQYNGSDSCGECSACKKISSGNHPDFLKLEAEKGLVKIDQVRHLKKTLSFPPFEAKFRVVFIADIHETMRRKEVANSLLKILEEPPADTVFILTAEEASGVLATIMSRCQVVPCYSLPHNVVAQTLVESALSQERAQTLALICEGSLGRAKKLAEHEFISFRKEIIEALTGANADKPETVGLLIEMAEKTAKLKDDIYDFFLLLKLWIRDLMVVNILGPDQFVVNQDLMHMYTTKVQRWNLSELFDKLKLINLSEKMIQQNCNKALVCEVLYWDLIKENSCETTK